jgi:hypothetical protein
MQPIVKRFCRGESSANYYAFPRLAFLKGFFKKSQIVLH